MDSTIHKSESLMIAENKGRIAQKSRRISIILQSAMYMGGIFTLVFGVVSIMLGQGWIQKGEILLLGVLVDILVPVNDSVILHNKFLNDPSIVYGIASGMALIFTIELVYLFKITKQWGLGETPFKDEYFKGLRTVSLTSMAFTIWVQPLFLIFGLMLYLFSYLMEYGYTLESSYNNKVKSHEEMILSLAEMIESKSEVTGSHVKRVSEYSKVLALGIGLTEEEAEEIRVASMLHDVGKMLIPTEILEKKGKLTDEEFTKIKQHTKYGDTLLKNTKGEVLNKARKIALEHHERWDGNGYAKVNGNNISVEARVVAVADVFDALVSKRSYKDSWSLEDAKAEISKCSGTQFDPTVVIAFNASFDKLEQIKLSYKD